MRLSTEILILGGLGLFACLILFALTRQPAKKDVLMNRLPEEFDPKGLLDVKQVIVIRRDLKMRRGKEIAQGSHASMYFIYEWLNGRLELSDAAKDWLHGGNFTKAVCTVQTEQELLDLVDFAKANGVMAYAMRDNGKTEFGGQFTYTAVAVGPDLRQNVDMVTGHLTLY